MASTFSQELCIDELCDRCEDAVRHGRELNIRTEVLAMDASLREQAALSLLTLGDEILPPACAQAWRQELSDLCPAEMLSFSSSDPPTACDQFPETGRQIDRFVLRQTLGRGAFGQVYLADDTVLDRQVAVKVLAESLFEDPNGDATFHNEAKAAAALRHPAICPTYEIGRADGHNFIVMAYIRGVTLLEAMQRRRPAPAVAAGLVADIAGALAYAHERGIVHRDLKPSNVMIDYEHETPIVMDFGLARMLNTEQSRHTQTGLIIGTPTHMSPEQARGDSIGTATDIWSLGVVLYDLLTGRRPFRGTPSAVFGQILETDVTPPADVDSSVPPALNAVCIAMLARDVKDRVPTMRAVQRLMTKAIAEPNRIPDTSGKDDKHDVPPRPSYRWPKFVSVVATAIVCGAMAVRLLWPVGLDTSVTRDAIDPRVASSAASVDHGMTDRAADATEGSPATTADVGLDTGHHSPPTPPVRLGTWKSTIPDDWVHGLIQTPARFTGVDSWQIEAVPLTADRGQAAFDASGSRFAVTGRQQLRVYQLNHDGFELRSIIGGSDTAVAWRPGQPVLAAASMFGFVRIAKANGEPVWGRSLPRPKPDNSRPPRLAWSPDGTHLAMTLTDRAATGSLLYIFDVDQRKTERVITTHQAAMDLTWPDANRLVAICEDSTLRTWNPENDDPARRVEIPPLSVALKESRVVLSPDGQHVAWCTHHNAGTLATWNAVTAEAGVELQQVPNFYYGNLKFSSDGQRIAALLDIRQNNVGVWDVESGERLWAATHANPSDPKSHEVAWTPGGSGVASVLTESPDAVQLWDIDEDILQASIPGMNSGIVADLAWSDNRSQLAFPGRDGRVKVLDTDTLQFAEFNPFGSTSSTRLTIDKIAWCDSRQRLAVTHVVENGTDQFLKSGSGVVFDLSTNTVLAEFPKSRSTWNTLAFSADGQHFAAAENAQGHLPRLFVWDLSSGKRPTEFQKNAGATERVFNSPVAWFGSRVHFFEPSGHLSQWDARQRLPGIGFDAAPPPGLSDPNDLSVDENTGRVVATGFRDQRCLVYGEGGRLLSDFGTTSRPISVDWHPKRNLLAVSLLDGHGTVLFGGQTYAPNGVNWEPHALLWRIRWNHDGSLLAGCSKDNTIYLAPLRNMQTWGIIVSFPDGGAVLLSAAGELISELRDAGKQLVCRFKRKDVNRWDVLTYDEFVTEFAPP